MKTVTPCSPRLDGKRKEVWLCVPGLTYIEVSEEEADSTSWVV